MADTPGRLLSSLSNADGRPPKVGGCVGVFFQLFDWNRRLSGKHLFSNKSLPAERPRSKKFDDDKVPMAKLLLIADENRGGFSRTSSSECQSEASSERSAESTSKKPGVVARLMGLESLPETENQQLQNRELSRKPPSQQQDRIPQYQELQMLEDLLQRDPDEIWRTPVRKQKLVDPARTSTEFGGSPSKSFLREEKMPRSRKKSQDHMAKKSGFSFTSVLSPSKSNKVSPPIKSQSGPSSRKSTLLLGAATKILEPAAARRRPLLEHKPSGVTEKAGRDLKRSLPKVAKDTEKQELARRGFPQTKSTAGLLHRGNSKSLNVKESNKNGGQQMTGTRSDQKLEPVNCDAVEPEEEAQSGECDSPASSSKENRQLPKSGGLVLRRSGSVKEEQPPTPPSRGSLFRSKSVKEEAPAQNQECTGKNAAANKEIRLKREKRQRPFSLSQTTTEPSTRKTEPVRRKPPLDQGRNSSLQEVQKNAKPSQGQSKGRLTYDRLFGSRKQSKKSEQLAPVKTEEQTTKAAKEDRVPKTKGAPKKISENSLVRSLLRRKPLSKADTVSSANKKTAEKPKYNRDLYPLYERQTRSAGSSPARNFNKDVDAKDNPEYDLLLMCERLADEDTYASDPEVFKERDEEDCERAQTKTASPKSLQERVGCEAEMPTDKSLEEILKTYLYKSLKSSKDDSPLGKAMAKLENQDGDPNVIDMEVSPADKNTVSRCDAIPEDMPSRVLFDEERKVTTPYLPNELLPDSNEVTAKVNLAGPEDSEQPSPISVLDFSAFPSDVATTSGEDNDEDAKHSLLSDAESGPTSSSTNSSITMQGILDSYDIRFPELSETGLNEMTNCGGHEIECYVRQVLIGSGLATDEPQTPPVPSPEEISQRLQKQQQLRKLVEFTSEMQVCSKKLDSPGPCERLMYESIEEALNSVLSPFREDNLVAVIAGCCWKQRPCGEELVAEVTSRILAWRDMTLGMVDDVVEADMTTSSAEWSLLRQETVEVGLEVERLVFRSVMEDLITEVVESNRPALPKLRSGFLSHHQHQQRLRSTVYRG